MNNKYIIITLWLAAILLGGCVIDRIKPFTEESTISPQTEGERRLWYQADDLVEAVKKSHQIYRDKQLLDYVQSIMDKLYPEFKGSFTVHILKAPIANAFALPNGSIFLCTGIIAAMDNEAQLATVLSHEGVHFLKKHGALRRKMVRNVGGAAILVPLFGDLAAISSILGYSREQEREADRLGVLRMVKAGYRLEETVAAFERLVFEAEGIQSPEPYFFSSHPKMKERIHWYREYIKENGSNGSWTGERVYQQQVAELREEVIKEKVLIGRYNSVITTLTHEKYKHRYPDHCKYYLGEAYRLRNKNGDTTLAVEAYKGIEEKSPGYVPTCRSLGVIYLKEKRYAQAKFKFEKYLQLCPDCRDIEFIKQYIRQIEELEP